MPEKPITKVDLKELLLLQTRLLELGGEVTMVIERARLAEVSEFEVKHKAGVPRGIKAIMGFLKSANASILEIQGNRLLEQGQKDFDEALKRLQG